MSDFDITPRAKRARQATNPLTPSASTRDESFDVSLARSSTATSRSSSPSKKQGHIEAEFSKPAHKFHTRASARRWKEQNHRQIPLFEDLQKAIHEDIPQSQDSITFQTQLKQILDGIEQCQTRDGTEDMWSDMVVNAVLQLAKQLAQSQHYIDVINVKSIDVSPPHLLPQRSQFPILSSIPKKRIDYTIGVKVSEDEDRMWDVLRDAENHTLAQNPHKMVRDRALCAHVEIKTGDTASSSEAKLQLFTWCAAGFAKQEELYLARDRRRRILQRQLPEVDQQPVVEQLAPVPLLRWTSDGVEVSMAIADSEKGKIDVLDEKRFVLDGMDAESLRQVVYMLVRIMDWGYTKYLPWFKSLLGEQDAEVQLMSL